MKNRNTEILKELNILSSYEDFLDILLILIDRNFIFKSDMIASRDVDAFLNENEVAFLFGLWLKNKSIKQTTNLGKESRAKIVHNLMNELHLTLRGLDPYHLDSGNFYDATRNNPNTILETIFYASSGAYDFQYVSFLSTKYKFDKVWLKKNKDLSIDEAAKLFVYIKSIITLRLNAETRPETINLYSFDTNNYVFKKNPNFIKILDLFSFNLTDDLNTDFHNIGDLNEFRYKPVIKDGSKYIIPIPYLLAEAMYDSPFYWMLEDKSYIQTALKNRGNIAEIIVEEILSKKINNNNIYKNVIIKKSREITLSDIDVCLLSEETMIVFQIKSKRLTQLSKKGDVNQFNIDFQQSVIDANNQANISKEAILSKKYTLIEKDTNKKIDISGVKEVYTLCIVLDSYPAITNHTRIFFYDKSETVPITMSIFDLEIMMNYITGFDMFCDYIKKRTLHSKYIIANSELCIFSNYLKNDLLKLPEYDFIALDSDFSQYFDQDFYLQLARKKSTIFIELVKNIGRNDICFCGSGMKFKNCCYG